MKIKKILLGITSSIAAYKAPELVRMLCKRGFDVKVVLTKGAQAFVTPLSLNVVSRQQVVLTEILSPTLKNDSVPRHDDAPRQAAAGMLIRYVLGLPISAAVVGMASLDHLRINVAAARDEKPLDKTERIALEKHMS